MPLTRNQADSMIERLTIPFYGEAGQQVGDLNITYRPNLLSRSEFRRLEQIAEQGGEEDAGLAPLLSRVILGWDFLQDDGQPYPVNQESLDFLGYPILTQIVKAMVGGPDPTTANKRGRSSGERRIMPPIESSASLQPATGESMRGY